MSDVAVAEQERVAVHEIPIIIRTDDGASISAVCHAGKGARASVVLFPAMGVEASFYHRFSRSLAGEGYNVLVVDLRGHGGHSVKADRSVRYGYSEMLRFDWPAAVRTLKGLFPALPVLVGGHSLGGQLSMIHAAMSRDVKGVVLLASGSVWFRSWQAFSALKVLAFTQAAWSLSEVLGYFPGDVIGFAGRESSGVMHDWALTARTGRYVVDGLPASAESLMAALSLPVLAVSFSDDDLTPRMATDNLLAKAPNARATHWHLSPSDLGLETVGHYSWAKQREQLVRRINEWLEDALLQRAEA